LDTLCTEVVKRVQDIIVCAPIANKAERYIAKKLANEMLDNG
jgi:ribulose-5-phosphate 4-epimerase/fuculose-1-phosphate aldolase